MTLVDFGGELVHIGAEEVQAPARQPAIKMKIDDDAAFDQEWKVKKSFWIFFLPLICLLNVNIWHSKHIETLLLNCSNNYIPIH